jgi:hypothetical protein
MTDTKLLKDMLFSNVNVLYDKCYPIKTFKMCITGYYFAVFLYGCCINTRAVA